MTRLLCVIAVVACAACGSGPAGGTAQQGTTPRGSTTATTGTAAQSGPGTQTSEQRPAADDRCKKLIEHVVALAIAERPAEQKPSDEDRANIATQLRTSWGPKCGAMTDAGYQCAAKAATLVELDRCGG